MSAIIQTIPTDLMKLWDDAAAELNAALQADELADGYAARLEAARAKCEAIREYVEAMGRPVQGQERFGWR